MNLLEVTPAPCLSCGRGNTPDSDGAPVRFVDLERDVNWNDPAILCEECVMKLGGMVGMLSMDVRSEFQTKLRAKNEEIHELKAEMDAMKRRAKKLGIEFVPVTS